MKRSDEFTTRGARGDPEEASPGNAKQQKRMIRRGYAKTIREEMEATEVFGDRQTVAPESRWPSRRRHSSAGELQRSGGKTIARIRRTAEEGVDPRREQDSVSRGSVHVGKEGARQATSGASKAIEFFRSQTKKASHFSTEKELLSSKRAASVGRGGKVIAINAKRSAFFRGEQSRAAAEAARSQAQKEFQKKVILRNYQQSPKRTAYIPIITPIREKLKGRSTAASTMGKRTARGIKGAIQRHPVLLLLLFTTGILTMLISAAITGGTMLMTHATMPSTLGSVYTADDADIKGVEADYQALERTLSSQVSDLQEAYPGYASYELSAGQIGHDPYKLAALLTVLHEDYKRGEVQDSLKTIFRTQYNLTAEDEEGIVTRKRVRVGESLGQVTTSGYCACSICCGQWAGGATASGAMPTANHTIAVDARNPIVPMGTKVIMNGIEYTVEDTGNFARYGVAFDIYYDDHQTALQHGHKAWEAYVADANGSREVEVLVSRGSREFSAVLKNNGIDYVAAQLLTEDEKERYDILVELKGNKPELFANDIYANAGAGFFDYTIAGEALSDERFANMMEEAKKYLGYPYVWGGSSPSTSFDCSGFVCWVINHSGNGWNVGRTTADGLANMLPKVDPADAKPGDIIFFQGTYNTVGASHVGIYLGDNMMIHCGSPIQYARTDTAYWQQHFYCFGRLP